MAHPVLSPNRMKLGIMAFNCSHGSTVTTADGAWELRWDRSVELARLADEAGFEALLPVGRWRGYGGATNFNGQSFETFTWAAGIGASTRRIAVIATVHAPLVHPVLAAKQAATVDHITGGRFVLNLVCGWNRPEFDMFGAEFRGHEERYAYAEEWLALVRRLWREPEAFDHDGAFFHGQGLWSMPKPVQGGDVIVMNAGSSPTGHRFSARHCDMNFAMLRQKGFEDDAGQIAALKTLARASGRASQCWIHGYVVCRASEKEAREYLHHYVVERGDDRAADAMVELFGMTSQTLDPSVLESFKFHFKAGHGGYPLIGTPEQIVDQMLTLSRMGVDGILLSWVDYLAEARQWIDTVMPLMVEAGLREAGRKPEKASA
jgi:alkanesulfonate monooxygenase SsuD/methylene tetrahydromethanopterin reductase-like flavin-dependent oxidoreductase (luciferase family)